MTMERLWKKLKRADGESKVRSAVDNKRLHNTSMSWSNKASPPQIVKTNR